MREGAVAVVIPVMGHPVLVDEALASVAAQLEGGVIARIIAVNDGCPLRETHDALASWRAHLGACCTVVAQRNAGLAAARNAGIEVAMADGGIDAVYLLDADNRLAARAGAGFAALLRDHPEADWFYPEFDFFGQRGHFTGEPAPSPLLHMLYNYSEAGSLIRRRVFDSGLRFDETLRQGYEDWNFFLDAAGRGFRGRPAGRPMLHYRKRPASMLAGSHSLDQMLRHGLRQRQPWLFDAATALAAEHRDFPRFAAIAGPEAEVRLGSDPQHWRATPFADHAAQLMRALAAPLHHHTPAFAVFAPPAVLDGLARLGLLRGLLWNAERLVARQGCGLVAIRVTMGDTLRMQIAAPAAFDADAIDPAAVVLCPLSVITHHLRRPEDQRSGWTWAVGQTLGPIDLTVPHGNGQAAIPSGHDAWAIATESLTRLGASRYRAALSQDWDWRAPGGAQSRARAHDAVRLIAGGGVVFPLIPPPSPPEPPVPQPRDIAFATSIFDTGGVEKVILALAAVLAGRGHRCHLVLTGRDRAHVGVHEMTVFSSVTFLPDPSASDWAGAEFLGTAGTSWGNPDERADLEGLLRPMDVVINAHSAAVHKVAGALRRGGTRMVDHEHLVEVSLYGRGYGPPLLALGYEHDYDAILTCSQGLADWMHAHGVPAEKLIPVVNAPGYVISPDGLAAALACRLDPTAGGPLTVLYFGRMDTQKGIDRVAAIFRSLAAAGRDVRLIAAGRAVMDTPPDTSWPEGTDLRGVVAGADAVTDLYRESDILILPSRYEGLPLVILEAQRCGVVPIATDVGAVAEAITDTADGFVVAEEGCVAAMTRIILGLADDRAALLALSLRARETPRTWDAAAAGLVGWIEGDGKRQAADNSDVAKTRLSSSVNAV